ncbi:MAG: hypothetical protein J6S53_10965, partial [Lentisphaeria bacterium]|nr:hypothetical protein [Lentisphaeria bacterium]
QSPRSSLDGVPSRKKKPSESDGFLTSAVDQCVFVRLHFIPAGQPSSPASLSYYILSIPPQLAGWLAKP